MNEKSIVAEEEELGNGLEAETENDDGTEVNEDNGTKTISVPKVTDMDTYFKKHYMGRVTQELNEMLAEGDMAQKAGVVIKSERILPEEYRIKDISYWRIDRSMFLIDLDIRVELRIQSGEDIDTDFFWFYLCFCCCLDDVGDEELSIYDFGLRKNRPDRMDYWRLDKYLVPVLRKDEIEKYTIDIWKKYIPEAVENHEARNPSSLAKKMGLTIKMLKLYKRSNTKGIIFFDSGNVLIQGEREERSKKEPDPVIENVPANTIVINIQSSSLYDYDIDLFHECIHHEWHYLFYKLQAMHTSDLEQLSKVKVTVKKSEPVSSPTTFMETQAWRGSYALMMPYDFMQKLIRKLYADAAATARKNGFYDHDGFRYEYVGRKIAETYNLSKARVKSRMLQLGYIAAIGALNYVDGRYITPFAISMNEDTSIDENNYVIDRVGVMKLYRENEKFRNLMQSGQFAFVDGHVAYSESNDIKQTERGSRLSAWANAHVDEVCLRFTKKYTASHEYRYIFGQMNNEQALKDALKFLDVNSNLSIKDAEKRKTALMEDMPMTFHGALSYIMKGRVTVDELTKRIPLSRSTILRLRTEERKSYDLDQVIALCVGLHLPPWLSGILLEKAGLTVKRYGPYGYYGTILDCFYMDTIEEVQQFLKDNDFDELKLNMDS